MADRSHIEWTDATWNVITGCSVVSPGCTNCYAMKLAGTRLQHHPSRAGLTIDSKAGPVWNGQVRFNADWLDQPLRWTKPRMIFVCAHGDLFHEGATDDQLDRIFAVMALTPHHTYQVLTKRSARMREYVTALYRGERQVFGEARALQPECTLDHILPEVEEDDVWDLKPLPNVWLGVSAEDQKRADERIPDLLATPAAVRWLSAEPLLGPIRLDHIKMFDRPTPEGGREAGWESALNGRRFDPWDDEGGETSGHPKLDWVVVGGESGPGARPMHPDWARQLRDQCAAADVPFFFKQWGDWGPVCELDSDALDSRLYHPAPKRWPEGRRRPKTAQTVLHANGDRFDDVAARGAYQAGSGAMLMFEIGKTVTGRTLDGRIHDGFPAMVAAGSPSQPGDIEGVHHV